MVDKSKLSSNTIRTVLIVICVILSFVMYMQRRTRNNLKQAAKLPFYNVQPAQVPDGTYHGKVYTSFMHVQVDVSVQDGRFTKIEIVETVPRRYISLPDRSRPAVWRAGRWCAGS